MTGKPIVPTSTFSRNPADGVLLAETLILGTDPELHAVGLELPYHYLMVVPSPDKTEDGRKVIRLKFYGMDGPPIPKHDRFAVLDGE